MTASNKPDEAVEVLTEVQMIDRELRWVEAMRLGPYRKGIVAGLKHRAGREYDPCPAHYADRAARNWSEGFEFGMFRDLRRWNERPTEGDGK